TVFMLLWDLGPFVPVFLYASGLMKPVTPEDWEKGNWNIWFTFSILPMWALCMGLILCTMRKRNGYRGLHELASSTRVVGLPRPKKRRVVPSQELTMQFAAPPDVPGQVGPFVIRGVIRWDQAAKLLLGEDLALGRKVVLWLRPLNQTPLSTVRK